jgi:predicted methyltransferase
MTPALPRRRLPLLLAALLALAACRAPAPATPPTDAASVKPGINDTFLSDDLDVEHFVQVFEGESREIAAQHVAITAALGLRSGEAVADVGAGTGLFLDGLADAVGPSGSVDAVDISPRFIEHLRQRVRDEHLTQARVVLCDEHTTGLPPASIDAALVCDTYHHFEHPQDTLASLRAALRPGGRLMIVDFEREPGVSRDWVLEHVRAGKQQVRAEVEAAGFTFAREVPVAGLTENYVLLFRRP